MQKKIETNHCQPEQIASYQKSLKTTSDKIKQFLDNQEKEEMEKLKQTQVQDKQIKQQKTQNIILGGILVSLLVLVGMGVYWILRKRDEKRK